MTKGRPYKDLSGQKYGRLLIISEYKKFYYATCTEIWWCICRCDCGKTIHVRKGSLRTSNTSSCGCMKREMAAERTTKHGLCYTKEYKAWQHMKDRCYNWNDKRYLDYGGRGIIVCDRWLNSFENFIDDMGFCPDGYSLDRINPNGNYEPSNCRWADKITQANNKRRSLK